MSPVTNRLPTDLSDLANLPEMIVRLREGFGLEWYEHHASDGTRSVVVDRYTRGGRFSWSACLAVSPGETFASITRRARELSAEAA